MDSIWVVGAGAIGEEHAKVFSSLNRKVTVIGRGEQRSEELARKTGFEVVSGGLDSFLSKKPQKPSAAIVAVPVVNLAEVTRSLAAYGVDKILLEKPGAVDFKGVEELASFCKAKGADVRLAYNRRFYSSVRKAKELILEDGGVTSFHFEFTEWADTIEKVEVEAIVKENWFLANSSHVLDLAFFLGGTPEVLTSYKAGQLSWHSRASRYSGAGISKNGATFSFCANWDAPGRWGVEVMTSKRRFIFRPLEKLQVQKRGSVAVEFVDCDEDLDQKFKAGFFRQAEAFIGGRDHADLLSLTELASLSNHVYAKIDL